MSRLRQVGCLADDPYPVKRTQEFPNDQLRRGARVFRRQCSVCHTLRGANALMHLTGAWDVNQMRMNLAKLQQTKPFMPPFAGTAAELEALVQFILWSSAGEPTRWKFTDDLAVLEQIDRWMQEAGSEPGEFDRNHRVTGSGLQNPWLARKDKP